MSGKSGKRLLMLAHTFVVTAGLAGCTNLPGWTGLHLEQTAVGEGVVYPDLAKIPDRPAPLDSIEERHDEVEALTADRARTAQAGTSLRHEIETGFQQPEPPSGP